MKGDNTEDSQTKSIDTDQLIDRLDELGNVAEELEDINHAIRDLTDRVVSFECRHGPNFLDGLPTPRRVR
jgi:hypothetical protein